MSTLNPFKLLALCLEPNGRFSRSQFAIVHLGALAVFGLLALGIEPAGRLVGASEGAAGILAVLAPLAFLPVLLLTFVGGGVRRCRDLGKPAWYIFFGFVPCAGVVPVLYLLLAPGRPDTEAPSESPRVLVAVAAVLGGVVGLGILATIAVQVSDQRAAANETMTVRDIRTLISAQTVYRESNGGLYEGNLECLARPSSVGCAPGLPADTLPFIDAALASSEPRHGYRRRFEPGRTTAIDPSLSSRTSVVGFAYVAVPVTPGARSLCGDSSGVVCFRADGADIPAPGGECPVTSGGCDPLV